MSDRTTDTMSPRTARRLVLALEALQDALLLVDAEGSIEYANRGAEAMFWCTVHELVARDIAALMYHPYGRWPDTYVAGHDADAMAPAAQHRCIVHGRRADGAVLYLEMAIVAIQDDGLRFGVLLRDLARQSRPHRLDTCHERHVARRRTLAEFERRSKGEVARLEQALAREDLCTLMEAAFSICQASRRIGEARLACACEVVEREGSARLAAIDAEIHQDEGIGMSVRSACHAVQLELNSLAQYGAGEAPDVLGA